MFFGGYSEILVSFSLVIKAILKFWFFLQGSEILVRFSFFRD